MVELNTLLPSNFTHASNKTFWFILLDFSSLMSELGCTVGCGLPVGYDYPRGYGYGQSFVPACVLRVLERVNFSLTGAGMGWQYPSGTYPLPS